MQGFHLGFPGDPDNFGRKAILPLRWLMSHDLIRDSRAMATTVQSSDLEWTVVRAPRVVVGSGMGSYRTGVLKLGPWNSVTNADVADFMSGAWSTRAPSALRRWWRPVVRGARTPG